MIDKTKTEASKISSVKKRSVTDYVAIFTALLARIGVVPTDADRAVFAAGVSDEKALADGARVDSTVLLAEWRRIAGRLCAAVLAGKLTGLGPVRFAYVCEIARQLAERLVQHDTIAVSAAGASEVSTVSLVDSRKARALAKRALLSLAGSNEIARARVQNAAAEKSTPDGRTRSLEALAKELERAVATHPASTVADAGITQQLIDSLRAASSSVLTTKVTRTDERGSVADSFNVLNVLDGKLIAELRNALASARLGHRFDTTVPAVSSRLVSSRRKKVPAVARPPAVINPPAQLPARSNTVAPPPS